jgi:hypothetical protein
MMPLSKRTKQIIPREFTRVASNLDESCGEEDFDKGRISIDWMNTCLANYTKDYSLGFCPRDKNLFLRHQSPVGLSAEPMKRKLLALRHGPGRASIQHLQCRGIEARDEAAVLPQLYVVRYVQWL